MPIEKKLLQGTQNVTRERLKQEPQYTGEENHMITLPPDDLSVPAQALWTSIVAQLASVGLNFPSNYEYIEAYCRLWEMREQAYQDYLKEGRYVVEGEVVKYTPEGEAYKTGGVKRISQSYKLYTDTIDRMILIGSKLGLTPVDKTKISTRGIGASTKEKNQNKSITVTG